MCVIIWAPNGAIPQKHVLAAMQRHRDGWGFSVAAPNQGVRTYRSVDRDDFLAAWKNRVRGPVVLHARWATHGMVCRDNCHPFRVRGHALVMAHNGIISGFGSASKSDTLDFIERVLEPMPRGFLNDNRTVTMLEHFIGASRMLFMDKCGTVTILNEELGVWRRGLWYSNETVLR